MEFSKTGKRITIATDWTDVAAGVALIAMLGGVFLYNGQQQIIQRERMDKSFDALKQAPTSNMDFAIFPVHKNSINELDRITKVFDEAAVKKGFTHCYSFVNGKKEEYPAGLFGSLVAAHENEKFMAVELVDVSSLRFWEKWDGAKVQDAIMSAQHSARSLTYATRCPE